MNTRSVYCLYISWGVLSFLGNRDLHKEVRKVCFSPAMGVTRNGKVRHYAKWRLEQSILQAIIQSKLPAPEFMVFNSNPYKATNLGNNPKSKSDASALQLRPPLHVQEFSIEHHHRDSDTC